VSKHRVLSDIEIPHDDRAEVGVLGSMLRFRETIPVVRETLTPEDFYHPTLKSLFRAICRLYDSDEPTTKTAVADALKSTGDLEALGGFSYLDSVEESEFTPHYAKHYASIVRDKSLKREVIAISEKLQDMAYHPAEKGEDILEVASAEVSALYRDEDKKECKSLRELSSAFTSKFEYNYENGGGLSGISTGWTDIDNFTGGLGAGELFILGARPSMGKTAWATSLLLNVARKGGNALLLSLEMSQEEIYQRLVAAEALVDVNLIRRAKVTDEEYGRIYDAQARLFEMPAYIDGCVGLPISSALQHVKRLKQKHGGLDLLIVDYLQLMSGTAGKNYPNRNEEVTDISRGLKSLAKAISIPVVALCQLSRAVESRSDKRPMQSDLRDSGSIEQDADQIGFLYRPSYYDRTSIEYDERSGLAIPDEVEFIMAKQRSGMTGIVKQGLRLPYCRFDDLAPGAF
jgi:replicative DNA helicase